MAERPLYTLYKNLKAQNYDVPNDYNKFESALTRDGKSGANNRHAIYENLKAQNFDVPDTYERFYTALFEPRSKTSSRAKGGSVPMSAADRARFLSGAAAISASAKQITNNAGRYNRLKQRKQRQQKDFGRVNLGTHLTPFGGDANNVVKDDFAYNPETGKAGAYVTSDNENAYTQSDAEQKQAILDKYGEEWNKAVDMGMVPSELDKADPGLSDTDVAIRQMERRQEWLDENQNRRSQELNESMHLQDSPFVASGGAVAPSSFNAAIGNEANRLSDAEYGAYNTAKAYNQMLRTTLLQELKEQKQRNENAGWWKDKWNDVSNYFGAMFNTMLDPKLYSQGVMDAAIASNLRQVKKGMEDGTIKKGSNAGNAAQVMLSAIQQQQGEAAKQQQYGTKAYQYGDVSGRSLKFMGDFALSGWRDVMTTGFTKAGEKVGEKMALGALGKWFTKNTGRVLGDMAGSAALAATNQLGSTYNNVIERYVGMNNENGGVTQDKDGDLSFNKGVSLGKAIKDGFGSATIENFSEMFGEYLPGASKLLSKLGLSKVSSFFEKIGNNAYYKWLSNATNKSGIQGVMSEISEEEFGTALHAAWGDGDGSWSDFNVFTNPDAREKQIDTCLGMFYSVGFMQSPRTAVGAINAVKYFNIKHQVTKADMFGQMMFNDKWDEIKSKIDVTTNADLTKTVLDATRSDSMTAKQKGAVINYAMFLSKLRGFNQASDAKTKDKVEEGETAPTLSNDLDDAYTEGHNADDADKHDIQIQQEDQLKTLAAALGISEQQLSAMSDEELESLTGQDDKLDQAIYDYQLSTARYQGVVDDAQDRVDLAAHQAEQRVNMYTDQSRGSVRNATIKASGGAEDYGVYIISGNIATHDDGSIDVSNSDDMILYFDPTTNSVEHADALMFAELGEELPADDVKAQTVADAKEKAIKEVAGIIDGTVEVGSQFSVTDADGTEHTYEVLADNGDGTAMITIDGNVPTELVNGENVQIPYSFEDLQKMKDLEDQKRLEAAKTEREQMEKERDAQETEQTEESQPSFDFNQILNDNGNVVLVDVLGKDGNTKYPGSKLFLIRDAGAKAKVVELKSDGTLVPHAVNKEDVATISTMTLDEYKQAMPSSMIEENSGEIEGDRGGIEVNDELPPVPDNVTINGDGTYSVDGAVQGGENTTAPSEQTEQTPAITLEDGTIVPMLEDGNPDFSKLSAAQTAELYDTQFDEDADGIVSGYVSDAKKALDKANNMTVKGKTFVEQKAAKVAKEKAIADAQAAYDSAIAIRDAYNERQLAKEENTPEGRKSLIEKAKRKFARLKNSEEWSERPGDLWNETVGKLLHRLYDATGIDVFNDTPNTVYEYVAANVGPYSLNYEGNDNSKGVQQETGLSRSDFAKLGWLAAEGKGMTIDAKVHRLWENRPSNLESADTQEIRNALISLITSGQTAFQARDYILNQRIELAESALEEQLRQEEDAAEARRAKEEEEKKKSELEKKAEEESKKAEEEKVEEEKTEDNENTEFSDNSKEESKTVEVPEDATDDAPLGEQLDESDLPFSAKDNGQQQTTSEREADVERNKVDDMKVVDNIVGQKTRKAFERLAKMMGAEIQWQYSDKLGNGWIQETKDADGNVHRTIFITLDSSITEGAQFIFGHEMTHQIKNLNPAAYNELNQLVLDTYGSDAFNKAVDETAKRYSDAGFSGRDREYYAEEVVADAVGEMIRDLNLAHTLAMKMSHPLLAAIHEILQKIKLAFYGTEYSDVTKNIIRSIEQAYIKTAKGRVENSETGENVSFSLRLKSAIEETETNPSDAQKESGNYKKGHIKFGGYDYTIENPKGSTRSGKDADGKEWKVTMHDTYGYIRGKFGKDGDHLDMFINDKADLDNWNGDVFVVDQVNSDGSFDEHKVMYGYDSMNDAEKAYLSNYSKGWQGLGNITGASKTEFDKWLDTSNRKLKPFADYAKVKFSQAQSVNNEEPKTFEEFLNHPSLKFSIKNEEQRNAAENAYEYAAKLRPNKYAQYAIVDMGMPSKVPEYYEKKVLADNWRRFYNRAVHNELNDVRKKAWGNYKLFDLDRPFADQVNEVKGNVPDEFDAPDAATNKDNIKGLDRQMSSVAETRYSLKDIKPVGVGAFGNIYNQFRGKSKAAIEFLKKLGSGEATAALHHHTIGDISLVWGDKKTGLDKILRKHPEVVDNLQSIIDSMEVVQESDNRVKLESPTHFAVVSKEYKGEPREQWLLTAYEKRESLENDKSMDTATSSLGGDTALSQSKGSAANIDNSSETAKENGEKFSLKGEKTLAGVHNITEEKLRKALKLGGFANPSLAVIDTNKSGHDNFGEISFIAPSALLDKRTGKTAGTWITDAYTQRYPSVEREMSEKGYRKFEDWVDSLDYPSGAKAEIERQAKDALSDNNAPAWELMYLKEKGIDIKAYDSNVDYRWKEIISDHPTAEDILNSMKTDPELNEKVISLAKHVIIYPTWEKVSLEVRRKIYKETGVKKSPISPIVRQQTKEIFERDYKSTLLNKDGSPRKKDVKKVVEDIVKEHNDTKKYDFYLSKVKASGYVNKNGLYDDYIRWQEKKLDEFGTKNRIFRGYKPDGTRKYVPETLDNVSKVMREEADGQTNGSEYTSFGSFIAKVASRVDSTDEMRDNKDKLSSNEDKEKFYEKWENVYYDLAKFLYNDVFYGEQRLHDIVLQSDPKKYAKKEYDITLTPTFMKKLDALKNAVQTELKSAYFETKYNRPLRLNEFAAAVVPDNLGEDVRKGIEDAGLPMYNYDPNKEGDRNRAFNEAVNSSDNIRFSLKEEKEKIVADAKANGTYMTAPNGEKTKLDAEQWVTVRTTNFKNWFGDWENDPENASKVVDENGEPMVVYHGTTNDETIKVWNEKAKTYDTSHEPFTVFKRAVDGLPNSGMFFNSSENNAYEYGYNHYAVYLNAKNPLVIDCKGNLYNSIKHEGKTMDTYDWANWAEENGFDGVIFKNIKDGVDYGSMQNTTDDYVVFYSNQIKSSENNNGDFSADNNDIRFSLRNLDQEYLDAVKKGDMEKAQRLVNKAAAVAGYSTDSSYQGTSAFNGSAPWGNGYFLTKEERKEAWNNGEFEGESTLGDYINDDIDGGNLEALTNTASYRASDPMRKEAIDNVRNAIQKKSKFITMYRSVPSDVKEGSFRNGDWITPSRSYAVDNAKLHGWGNDYNIIEQKVPVDDVWFDGNDIAEWGYGIEKDYINDTDFAYKNVKNNRKLLDVVTYNDNGEVIPLSQRFDPSKSDTRFSLRYDKFEHDLNQWKKDNNLPKDAKRPTIPQRNVGESAVDFLKRVDEYRKQMALWKTAPTYEQHLLSDDTALGEFNRELQRGSVLKRIAFQDSMLAIRKAQEAIMKEVGVDRLNMAEDAYTAENRSHGKGKNEFEEYNNEFLQPLRKAYHQMKKVLGDSYDNVRLYMMAKHGLERDAQMAFKKSLDADYEDVAQRSVAYRAYKGDIDRIVNDTDLELGRVDFTTWRQRDNALRSKYSPSYMNFRYDKMGIAFDYSGLSALFDGSDFEEAAYKLVRDIESKHIVETKELWDATNAATKKILRDGYKAGMMSKDTYQYVRDMYGHYIPLRGWDGTTADQVWDYVGGGNGAFNQTLKKAHGRTSIADDPIAYIENMAESGILLNNKNWVKQHLMLLAQNHPTSLLTISKAWYVKSADANGNEEWIPATPQITSQMNSNQVKAAIDAFEQKMEQMEQTGDATQKRDGLNIAYPQTHSEEREHEVRVMKDGEEYVIYVNGDPQLAQAMNNTRAHRVREIQSGKLDRAAAWLGRKMAAAYTSLSPLFIPSNYFRDLTMTLASTAIREDAKYNYLLRKNLATSWNLGFMLKDYQNGKLREKVSNGNATPKEQMFYDFMMNGGETGFVSSLDVDDLKKKFKSDLKDLDRWKANPVKVGHTIMDGIEFLNRAIEDSNRFAIYMTSIQYGRSIDEAVNDAKDVTLNFNRKGTGEYGWQMIRNLYLFINPAVQSLQTLGALAKHHPFKFTAVTASWLASGVLVPIVNAALMSLFGGGDDKDKYWQFTKWDRRNNLIMWVPFTHEYVKIPLAQEFRAFYGVGDMIASKMMGGELAEESWNQYAEDLLGQVVDMLPLDPTGYDGNIAVSLVPNAIRPVFELAFNVDFTGKPLFKDTEYNKYDPNFTKAYVGTPDWLVRASKMVNSIGNDYPDVQQNSIDAFGDPRYNLNNPAVVDHILSSYLGGAYTMGSQVLGLLTKSLNDTKKIKVADIPLVSKFVSNPDDRPVTKKQGDEFWDMKENHDRAANTLSKLKKQAKVDGDYSMLERFYGSEEYRQYKQDDVKVKKYEEDKKKERAEESGEEYRPHKLNAWDIYKAHATPKDDFEDLKLKQLYTKLNGFKSTYDLLVDTAPSQSDGYYNANKAAIDAIDEVSLDKQEISELKKGFLDDGKDAYNAEDMKRIRELRKKVLAVLENANKIVVANQKAKKK